MVRSIRALVAAPERRGRFLCPTEGVVRLGAAWLALGMLSGCATLQPQRLEHDDRGRIYYIDGAGGGGVLFNWGHGVCDGLRAADVKRAFYSYPWQTGFGVLADQTASVEYKRSKARELADLIRAYLADHPDRTVDLIAFSAGTAVALYALEALPPSCFVDTVVLVGSSVSSGYDLTAALRHVRGRLYVFTSPHDAVLGWLLPLAGTADRVHCGSQVAGLVGFAVPAGLSAECQALYAKVTHQSWQSDFARAGNHGGHMDMVGTQFVARYVAPLLGTGLGEAYANARTPPR